MNHKELISAISSKLSISKNEVEQMLDTTVSICTDQLKEGITIGFQSFGNFEVRKLRWEDAAEKCSRIYNDVVRY